MSHFPFKFIFTATQFQKIPEYDIFQKALFSTLPLTMNLGLTLFQLHQWHIYEEILLFSPKN